jgi:hypothetical protein
MPALGTSVLYRPVPTGFDDLFIRVGWSSIEAETRAHAKTIRKWLDQRNAERRRRNQPTLQDARRAYVVANGPAQSPTRVAHLSARRSASRYALGRTSRKFVWKTDMPRFWDFGLLPAVTVAEKPRQRGVRISPAKAAAIVEQAAAAIEGSAEFMAGMRKAAELLRARDVQSNEFNGNHHG